MKMTSWDRLRGGGGDGDGIWLISYADMITLLLTFFVALLSTAKVDRSRFEQMSAALNKKATASQLAQLEKKVDSWAEEAGMKGKVAAELGADGLRVQFTDALLFESGKAVLTAEGGAVVDRFLGMLAKVDTTYGITIEGHTDDVPIATGTFKSNWELSSQRAIEVLRRFLDRGVAKERLSVQGFADTRPVKVPARLEVVDPKAQVDYLRSLNRRVVIVVH
jgi:chemotaxis protein MotB